MRARLALCAVVLALAGCATLSARRSFEAMPLLAPASFGADAARVQRLAIARIDGGATLVLDAAVEVDADALRVAGLMLGRRLLHLAWDGRELLQSRDPVVPASLDGRGILRDLQLVYWPAAAIRPRLPASCELEERGRERRLLCNRRLVFESRRDDDTPLGAARLVNHLGRYMISIEAAP